MFNKNSLNLVFSLSSKLVTNQQRAIITMINQRSDFNAKSMDRSIDNRPSTNGYGNANRFPKMSNGTRSNNFSSRPMRR